MGGVAAACCFCLLLASVRVLLPDDGAAQPFARLSPFAPMQLNHPGRRFHPRSCFNPRAVALSSRHSVRAGLQLERPSSRLPRQQNPTAVTIASPQQLHTTVRSPVTVCPCSNSAVTASRPSASSASSVLALLIIRCAGLSTCRCVGLHWLGSAMIPLGAGRAEW